MVLECALSAILSDRRCSEKYDTTGVAQTPNLAAGNPGFELSMTGLPPTPDVVGRLSERLHMIQSELQAPLICIENGTLLPSLRDS